MSFISLFDCFFNSLSILIFSPYGLLTTLSLWKFMCVLVCVRKHVLRTTGGKEKIWPKGQGWAIWMRDDPLGSRVWTLGLQLITLLGRLWNSSEVEVDRTSSSLGLEGWSESIGGSCGGWEPHPLPVLCFTWFCCPIVDSFTLKW